MKKLSLLAGAVAAAAFVMTGCTSVNTSDGAVGVPQPDTKSYGYRAIYNHKDVRVTGEANVNVLFGIFAWGANGFADNCSLTTFSFLPSPANFAKSAAVYNTCKKNNADTLLGTRYTLTTTDYFVFKQVKCVVAGFPATMSGVKKLEPYVLKNGESLVFLDQAPKK